MKIYLCPACQHVVYFESTSCMSCGARLGFIPELRTIAALAPKMKAVGDAPDTRDTVFTAQVCVPTSSTQELRFCANHIENAVCNWTVPADDAHPFCLSCRLNDVIPNLEAPGARTGWARLESAKRRLLYTLLALDLPLASRQDDPQAGLAFAFKQDIPGGETATTGHANGIITINVAEADDAHREKTRAQFGEKYRSLLGHFRHESGHYYWERLIAGTPWLDDFRERFGDERTDYAAALARHYGEGPPPAWPGTHVSPYASAHPWEDWAETWAHYLHIVDTFETAHAYGLTLRPQPVGGAVAEKVALRSVSLQAFDAMIAAWVPLTLALNDFNRGMGLPDLYPFALSTAAIEKMAFVHRVVHERTASVAGAAPAVAAASA